jgi:hypothetical protein
MSILHNIIPKNPLPWRDSNPGLLFQGANRKYLVNFVQYGNDYCFSQFRFYFYATNPHYRYIVWSLPKFRTEHNFVAGTEDLSSNPASVRALMHT